MAMGNSIDQILASRRQPETPANDDDANKFYSILVSDGSTPEHFLELQLRNGLRTCFAYGDLSWFNLDPEAGYIDMEFGGFLVTIKGRGMGTKLFTGLRTKRVAWIKEADSEFQDRKELETYIEEITITPPGSESGKAEAEAA